MCHLNEFDATMPVHVLYSVLTGLSFLPRRYALICQQCLSHNGMALKEEFEYVGKTWRNTTLCVSLHQTLRLHLPSSIWQCSIS